MSGQKAPIVLSQEELEASVERVGPKGKTLRPVVGHKRWARFEMRNIEVTQDDINGAMRANSHSCMIAEAIKRQVPGVTGVQVDIHSIRFVDAGRQRKVLCDTPGLCMTNLVRFDRGIPPQPFKFSLRSRQVTPRTVNRPKLDESGLPMTRVREREYTAGGGELAVRETLETVMDQGCLPSKVKVSISNSRGDRHSEHTVGGHSAPRHRPSFKRKFGIKGFTWDEGEDERSVLRRHAEAGFYKIPSDALKDD